MAISRAFPDVKMFWEEPELYHGEIIAFTAFGPWIENIRDKLDSAENIRSSRELSKRHHAICHLKPLAVPDLHCGPVRVFRGLKLPPHGFDGDRPMACQPLDPTQLGPASLAVCFGVPISGV